MARLKLVIFGLIGLFVLIQLIPVNQNNPAVLEDVKAPEAVKMILKTSCYDCHSNETKWPWYSRIAPGSFLITRDVLQGREHLNFSEFANMDAYDSADVAEELLEVLEDGKMPLKPYLILHPDASLSASKTQILTDWATSLYPE